MALRSLLSSNRVPKDLDIIATYDDAIEFIKSAGKVKSCLPEDGGTKVIAHYFDRTPIEAEIAWVGTSAYDLLQLDRDVDLNMLYMLKMSHRYRKDSPHFLKTMGDIWLLRRKGATITEELQPIYEKRIRETYYYSHPKLNVDKQNFFKDDNINYMVDHDLIHTFVKLFDRPAYTMFGVPGKEVLSSKERFFTELSDQQRLAAVWEESAVLAIERSLLPHPGVLTPQQAFLKALEKVCTSITSGWFREYSYENYYAARDLFSPDLNTIKLTNAYNQCLSKLNKQQ